jgi:2-keto-4-pentenoate hydratase/2-oxohepta-3-ene-1,7-dioic acid hydratase in catechol pathway
MKLVTFRQGDKDLETGVLCGDRIVSLRPLGLSSVIEIASAGPDALFDVQDWVASSPPGISATSVRLVSPIPRPPKIVCIGLNYREHALEAKMPIPTIPTVFSKFNTAVIGPGDAIILPRESTQPDYEAELAFVVGKGRRYINKEAWRDHVLGYTIMNDVTARDYQFATSQWIIGKNFDTFAPIGPWVVTADAIPDPHALDISLRINDEVLQSSNTKELIFKIPELVAYLSSVFTLEPGDIISTGTPSGVGVARVPPRFLRCGDELKVFIEGIGELRNYVLEDPLGDSGAIHA